MALRQRLRALRPARRAADPGRRQLAGAGDAAGRARRAVLRRARRAARRSRTSTATATSTGCMSWGPLVFGHADPETLEAIARGRAATGRRSARRPRREVELAAEIVDAVPSVEMVRLVSSGTEAAMSAVRLARGVHAARPDASSSPAATTATPTRCSPSAGSGLATLGIPSSPGVPTRRRPADTVVAPYNDVDAAAAAVERYGEGLAAIIVEPVAGNMGVVPPAPGFLEALRAALRRLGRAARLRRGDHRLPRRARRRAGALRRAART